MDAGRNVPGDLSCSLSTCSSRRSESDSMSSPRPIDPRNRRRSPTWSSRFSRRTPTPPPWRPTWKAARYTRTWDSPACRMESAASRPGPLRSTNATQGRRGSSLQLWTCRYRSLSTPSTTTTTITHTCLLTLNVLEEGALKQSCNSRFFNEVLKENPSLTPTY